MSWFGLILSSFITTKRKILGLSSYGEPNRYRKTLLLQSYLYVGSLKKNSFLVKDRERPQENYILLR